MCPLAADLVVPVWANRPDASIPTSLDDAIWHVGFETTPTTSTDWLIIIYQGFVG
jgi:hypothetical protein